MLEHYGIHLEHKFTVDQELERDGMLERKEIEKEKADAAIARLGKVPAQILTVRKFIETYFEELHGSGLSTKALHQFLSSCGIDVGTVNYFRVAYNKIKRTYGKNSTNMEIISLPQRQVDNKAEASRVTIATVATETEEIFSREGDKKKEENAVEQGQGQNLEGMYLLEELPDGRKIYIDPKTGAKKFSIR